MRPDGEAFRRGGVQSAARWPARGNILGDSKFLTDRAQLVHPWGNSFVRDDTLSMYLRLKGAFRLRSKERTQWRNRLYPDTLSLTFGHGKTRTDKTKHEHAPEQFLTRVLRRGND